MSRPRNDRWIDLVFTLNGFAFFCCLLMALGENKFPILPAFMNLGVMALMIRFVNINHKEQTK
jgi:hypothetical protein